MPGELTDEDEPGLASWLTSAENNPLGPHQRVSGLAQGNARRSKTPGIQLLAAIASCKARRQTHKAVKVAVGAINYILIAVRCNARSTHLLTQPFRFGTFFTGAPRAPPNAACT